VELGIDKDKVVKKELLEEKLSIIEEHAYSSRETKR
jgi:hypothetical protein